MCLITNRGNLAQNMAPMYVYVCLITDLEWVTPERSIVHLCVCVCKHHFPIVHVFSLSLFFVYRNNTKNVYRAMLGMTVVDTKIWGSDQRA